MSVSGFILRAACHGRRPSRLVEGSLRNRPALVAQLAKNREVARFIVAPAGYGKSCLALEYAETMKVWAHTFWINAQSPCYMRDLDDEMLASYVLECDAMASLVVFDDVPLLDYERGEKFSRAIDVLLSEGCEVLVTCRPTCDTFGTTQGDRIRMSAKHLLLSDEELDEVRPIDERMFRPSGLLGPAKRIPELVWSLEAEKEKQFAKKSFEEELPNDFLLAMASSLVLQQGSCSDLLPFGSFDEHVFEEMENDYPHFSLDAETERFEAPLLQIHNLTPMLRKCLLRLTERSAYETIEQLVAAWAAALMRNANAQRACQVIQEICPRGYRALWVVDNAPELVRQACFAPTCRLITSQTVSAGHLRSRLSSIEALCRRLLGDKEGALRRARKNAFDDDAPDDARILSLLLLALLDEGMVTEQARRALEVLRPDEIQTKANGGIPWKLLVEAWHARVEGVKELARLWQEYRESGVDDDMLCICASWLFDSCADMEEQPAELEKLDLQQVINYVSERLADDAIGEVVDFYLISAGLAMERAHAHGLSYEAGVLDTASLLLLRQVEMGVISQRRLFVDEERADEVRRRDWAATHPTTLTRLGVSGAKGVPERSIPILNVKLFGAFEVSIGGVPLDYARFKRQNTRALLVMLAVNQGRELARDAVAEAMWPRSSLSVARKNFYTVWSHLRKALALPDGTCPYLVRHRYGCSLDDRYVQSDVNRFNEVCRELLFSSPDVERWSLLFAEIDRDFSSDLVPAETSNGLIIRARNDYRTRLVDALVAATGSILDADIPQWGVWFARAAVDHDDTREDAYVALMRAQIAGNQRTAAMMTYLKCRKVLSDKLGIDPSPDTRALYEGLLDSDDEDDNSV